MNLLFQYFDFGILINLNELISLHVVFALFILIESRF
jgi:hypothetical protein